MSLPSYWREIPQRYRLEASCCTKCGATYFPPRVVCSGCGCRQFETVNLPETGKLVTYTIIHVAPSRFVDQVPYAVGIVEFDGGTRAMMQVVDVSEDKIKIGMPVRIEFRKLYSDGEAGVICYGYKAVPA